MVQKNTSGDYSKYISSVNLAGNATCKNATKTPICITI